MTSIVYHYNADYSVEWLSRFELPSTWQGYIINGTISIPVEFQFPLKYWVNGTQTDQTYFDQDFTHSASLSLGSLDTIDGFSIDLVKSGSSDLTRDYVIVLHFDNYYCPYVSSQSPWISIPIVLNYSMVAQKQVLSSPFNHLTALTAALYLRPKNGTIGVSSNYQISPARFVRDREYYNLVQALNEFSIYGLGDIDVATTRLFSIVQQFTGWDFATQLVELDFPNFASQLFTVIRQAGAAGIDLSITNNLISQVVSKLTSVLDSQVELESLLSNLYDVVSDRSRFSSSYYDKFGNIADLPSYLACILYGLTGVNAGNTISFQSISDLTYNRWVDLISSAVASALAEQDQNVSANLATDRESAGVANMLVHNREENLWADVSSDLLELNVNPPSQVTSTAVWYTGAVEGVWSRLGVFSFVLSVALIGGYFVVVLGRIGGMSRGR